MDFGFFAPTRVVFGVGAISRAGEVVSSLNPKSVLVVTGRGSMRKTGVLDNVIGLIKGAGINVAVFEGVKPDPPISQVDEGSRLAHENNCDLILGLGGGSALDAAKSIAVSVGKGKPIREFVDGPHVTEDALPIVAIPSTAGTGSETSRAAIIVFDETGVKGGVRGNALFPVAAIVDPELTLTVPRDVSFDTGFDALAHAIESYISRKASPVTDALAVHAMKLIAENLPKVVEDGSDIKAREGMCMAATLMGFNIANSTVCVPHRMQYPLAAAAEASHGRALSALIPAWIGETLPHAKENFGSSPKYLEEPTQHML